MNHWKVILSILTISTYLLSCKSKEKTNIELTFSLPERPNILWLVAEDLGPYIPTFGDSTVATPNLSKLASEGVRYTHVFSPSGVCAPSRAAIATGMYPSSIGANHMRTGQFMEVTGLPRYEAVPPREVKMFSEHLRMAGYYCSNNSKTDYQFRPPVTAWDESSRNAHWRNRGPNQPFFSIFNFGVTHESGLFEPYKRDTLIPIDTKFPIPPYLPDNNIVRRDMWKMYNNIALLDRQIGNILDELESDGILEKTIIFFYADHGGPLPRQKRMVYDSGLNVPMIIRYPNKLHAGKTDDQLINFIDFAPTLLSLLGQTAPSILHGQSFINNNEKRQYIHAAADRFDGVTDVIRAVRNDRYKYIRNYRPEQNYYLPVAYRERIPTMKELLRLRDDGQLNDTQALWFRENKPKEELYDCINDPHELNNLALDSKYTNKLKELSDEMDRWLQDIGDQPNLPERELITQLWQNQPEQPITLNPTIKILNGKIELNCDTEGASIGYRIIKDSIKTPYQIYQKPFTLGDGSRIETIAHRIGFKPSSKVHYETAEF